MHAFCKLSNNIDKMSFTMQLFILASLPFLLSLLLFKSYFSSSNRNLPPSPPKLPLIGNLHQLGSSPHRVLRSMAQTYGPLMLVHFGIVPVVVASSVDAAREILKTHDLTFANRPFLKIAGRIFYDSKDIVFAPYGEHWRQARSISVLHLLSNKRVQSFRHVREDELGRLIEKIERADGSVVNLSELLISVTNNVVCRVALGRSYEEFEFKKMPEQIGYLLGCFSIGSYIPWLGWVDRLSGLSGQADEVFRQADLFYEGVVEEHLNKKESGVEGQSLVDILLEIQRNNSTDFPLERQTIKAILMDIFGAGTDTTFTGLEWAMSELIQNPRVMKVLQKEAQEMGQGRSQISEEDVQKMPYLKAVLKETLRLHPPIPLLVPHESTKDVKLFGYDIPSGTQVVVNAWAIGHDPLVWKEPEEFRPERFLNNPIDYRGFDFELIPFGAGRRGCPGISFAMVINELVLANLVYQFNFASASAESLDMSDSDGITTHRKFPLLVTATPSK